MPPSPSSRLVLPVPLSPSIPRRFSRYIARDRILLISVIAKCDVLFFCSSYFGDITVEIIDTIAALLDDSFKTRSLGLFTWARVLYELGIPVGIISFFLSKEHTMEILGTIEKSRIDFKLAICVLLFYLYHNGA